MPILNTVSWPNHQVDTQEEEYPDEIIYVESNYAPDSINKAFEEFADVYKERLPYVRVPTLNGNCYSWSEIFIYNCQMAMSTDKLVQFTDDEADAWWNFVSFENYHSTSANLNHCNGLAIGCTIPDAENKSFVVCEAKGTTTELCEKPTFEVLNEEIWKSLDKVFMDIYNCIEVDDCDRTKTLLDISPCSIMQATTLQPR